MDTDDILALLNDRDLSDIHPNMRPRKAASLIVTRGSGHDTYVLMGKRSEDLTFMPGKYVFPGGGVERSDNLLKPVNDLPERERKLLGPQGMGFAMAAIRECFEETGLRVAAHPAPPSSSPLWRAYSATGLRPDLTRLSLVARAITPPKRVRRFDTYFFCCAANKVEAEKLLGNPPSREISQLSWVPLNHTDTLDIALMTRAILESFKDQLFNPDSPKPFYRVRGGKFISSNIT